MRGSGYNAPMTHTTRTTLTLLALLICLPAPAPADALDDALALAGLERRDLGWRRRGHWRRYPADIPYKLRHFDGLLDEPLATVRYTRTFGAAARTLLDEKALHEKGPRGAGALYRLVHNLGVSPRFGGFRAYSANLTAKPTPLDEAILKLHAAAGRATRFHTFGQDATYPDLARALAEKVKRIPAAARPILGQLVLELIVAHRWTQLAFRRVPLALRARVAGRLDIGAEETDALEYAPSFDDTARAWDEASLWYAALRCTEALDRARLALAKLPAAAPFRFDWQTPLGWIRIRGGGKDAVRGPALLIVDLGGDDTYTGAVAAATPQHPIALLLDMGGNDTYTAQGPAQGAGICGVGLLLDAAGNDTYQGGTYAQGAGQFGLGALLDLAGDDRYTVRFSGQGCGFFGVGLLADAAGKDVYTIESDGQGFGGVAGVGVLADRSGDDTYVAIRDPGRTGRPSYHSKGKVAVSNAQGCAMGRRGDGSDGHSWAGGLGLLLDVEGNDSYSAGNWSMGTGYWFGTGLLWDGGGDDRYKGVVWSQGSGAHFCIGALIDEGGDDLHELDGPEGGRNGLAFGHDFTVALLINVGGNDRYRIAGDGLGFSINRSVAMLIDTAGADRYESNPRRRPGMALFTPKMADRTGPSVYFAEATSVGLFLDIGGKDVYKPERANDSAWLDPKDSPNHAARNRSVGVDRASGRVVIEPFPEKAPRRTRR